MNTINLPMAELKPALIGLSKVINKQGAVPILTGVKIERTRDGWITLTSTDMESFITVRMEQPTDGDPISLVLPYEELLKTANRCSKDDSIFIGDGDDRSLVILKYPVGRQLSEQKCISFPVEDFPKTPRVQGEPVPVNEALRQVIHEALDCASSDPTRRILNGIIVDVSVPKCHQVVGTDGSHLYASNSFSLPLKDSILVPDHKFLGWKGFNSDGEWQLKAGSDVSDGNKPLLQVSSRRWRFITYQHEGTYPNWRHVVPTEFRTSVLLNGEVLDSALEIIQRIPYDIKSANKPIFLRVDGKKLIIGGRNKDDEKWTEVEVPGAKITGPAVTIYLNREFALKALKFGLNQIEILDGMSPLRFSNGGKQMIVMPIKAISDPSPTPERQVAKPKEEMSAPPVEINERRNMVNEQPESAPEKPAMEMAMDQLETLKESLKGSLASVTSILSALKIAQREQKVTEREFRSIEGTLRSLQSVRI